MVGDLIERIEASRNKVEELISQVPGFKGYKQKETRREADKLLRSHVAREYEALLRRINALQRDLSDAGELRLVLQLDRATVKLQMLADRIKTASYGYAGVFDAIKVNEEILDALYTFDLAMMDGVARVSEALDAVAAAGEDSSALTAEVESLLALLDELNDTFSKRQDIILA
ncbi:MAG: hypothetical protein ACP5G7_05245 [Anaerolineae bacterium]